MNENQCAKIGEELTRLQRLHEKTDKEITSAIRKHRDDLCRWLVERNAKCLAQMDAIKFVLDAIGYEARFSIESGKGYYKVEKLDF